MVGSRLVGVVIGLVVGLTGASAASAPDAPADGRSSDQFGPGTPYHRTELYFGTGKKDGSFVTPEEFENFVDKELTPAFPDGLTEVAAKGEWKGASGVPIKEGTYVVIVLYPLSDRHADSEIELIRADYKRFFDQESVLRVDAVEQVSF